MFVYPGKLILIAKKNYKCIYGINIKNNEEFSSVFEDFKKVRRTFKTFLIIRDVHAQ